MIGEWLLHYRVTEKIGEGGMGAVYRADDTHLDRPVAIKVLPPDKVADEERRQRFVQEAKAASALRHPNIVVIHDIASAGGREFIVMELVEGQPLDALIGRKGLKLTEALRLAVQMADGLAKAHAAGIVHRDFKPSNVMVTGDGQVKVLDFGLAKLRPDIPAGSNAPTRAAGDDRPRTGEGFILGTAAYMSPEQAEGKPVDGRSDVFSFGAVLYEMLTGRRAFARETGLKTLAAVLDEEPPPVSSLNPSIPVELERIVTRCLRKAPQRRWQTMSDLKVALEELKEDSESGRLRAVSAPAAGRGRRAAVFLGATVLLLAAAVALVIWRTPSAPLPAVTFEILPVTLDTGLTAAPTIPADASLIAYASDRPGSRGHDIWVQRAAGGTPLQLTDDPGDDSFPSFSPDGSLIAFNSSRGGGGIYLIEALAAGGVPRRLAERGVVPRFSPDGRLIAYVVLPASGDARRQQAFVVSPKGGQPRQVLRDFSFAHVTQGAPLVWSPDGTRLLFAGERVGEPGSRDWWVAPVDGGEPVRTQALRNLGLTAIVLYPVAWRGNEVYFTSGTTIDGLNLSRARIDPGAWSITGPVQAVTSGPGLKSVAEIAPDGRLFFANLTVAMTAWSVPARPDAAEVVGRAERLTRDLMQNFNPSVSRDGSRAAFTAFGGAASGRLEIRLLDLHGGREASIPAQGLSMFQKPRLSADGSWLAYRDVVEGKQRGLLLPPGAGSARELCEACTPLDFFPGNDSVLVQTGREALERMDLGSGVRSPVLSTAPDGITDARLSSDGRFVAWRAAIPDGRVAIRVAELPAGQDRARAITVIEADYFLSAPAWSPNGRWLYYLTEKSSVCGLVARAFDPRSKPMVGPERPIPLDLDPRLRLNFPRGLASMDVGAGRIVFEATELKGNVYVARPAGKAVRD